MDAIRTETPMEAGRRLLRDSGYSETSQSEMPDVKRRVKKGLVGYEDAETGQDRQAFKSGGAVSGDIPAMRPDKRARGGNLNGVAGVDRRYQAEGINQPHGPEQHRANGGNIGSHGHKVRGRHSGPHTVNVIVGKGSDDGGKEQAAHQAGMQQGAQMVMQKIAASAPRPPMAPPPGGGAPPGAPGPMVGGPPMMGSPGAPRPPMPPQMAANGGIIKVRAHHRRVGGSV